jgi:hypothetical protein
MDDYQCLRLSSSAVEYILWLQKRPTTVNSPLESSQAYLKQSAPLEGSTLTADSKYGKHEYEETSMKSKKTPEEQYSRYMAGRSRQTASFLLIKSERMATT